VSVTKLTGTTPAGSTTGTVDVVVYTTSAGSGSCFGCYTYNPLMTVTGISPNSGSLAGGTAVTITGTNFPATVDSVRVGTGRLGGVARSSDSLLAGTTPGGMASGAVDVTVYTTSAGSGSCIGCFTYSAVTGTWTGGFWTPVLQGPHSPIGSVQDSLTLILEENSGAVTGSAREWFYGETFVVNGTYASQTQTLTATLLYSPYGSPLTLNIAATVAGNTMVANLPNFYPFPGTMMTLTRVR
jgi:hypothetical protein